MFEAHCTGCVPLVDTDVSGSDESAVRIVGRFPTTSGGFLIDSGGQQQPVWACAASEFELWLAGIEGLLDMPLGRRLAHAAAESEEWRLSAVSNRPPRPLFNKAAKQMAWLNADWYERGMGEISLLRDEATEIDLVVRRRPHPALAAGMASAAWERLQKQRYRFRWSDGGTGESIVSLELDNRNIPSAEAVATPWEEAPMTSDPGATTHPFQPAFEESGNWTLDGIRMLTLTRDLLLRFEDMILPHLADQQRSSDPRVGWKGIDDADRLRFWDALAETSKSRFIASAEMVLVAEPSDWIDVGNRFLAASGLGSISTVERIDDAGGVRLTADSLLHPAIAVGILLGAWERAEARQAGGAWTSSSTGHIIELASLRDLA